MDHGAIAAAAGWVRGVHVPAAAKQAAGYVASALVLATFSMKSMRRLRAVAIASNIAFIVYATVWDLPPILVLHCILLPTNLTRLIQMRRADAAAKRLLAAPEPEAGTTDLARARFLAPSALADPDAALPLAEREQERVAALLAARLPGEAAEMSGVDPVAAAQAAPRLLDEIDRFLVALAGANLSAAQLHRLAELHSRNEILAALHETLGELAPLIAQETSGRAAEVAHAISAGLGTLLLQAEEAARSHETTDIAVLIRITGDRGALVEGLRRSAIADGETMLADYRAVHALTSLYERSVWLLRRYGTALERQAAAA